MFDYRQAEAMRESFARHDVRCLFIGDSGAVLLGFPETIYAAQLFAEDTADNRRALIGALKDLGYSLDVDEAVSLAGDGTLIQLRSDPLHLEITFAPAGLGSFEEAWQRRVYFEGIAVCHPDDVTGYMEASGPQIASISPSRMRAFRDWWTRMRLRETTGEARGGIL